jgi:hypothetical protein
MQVSASALRIQRPLVRSPLIFRPETPHHQATVGGAYQYRHVRLGVAFLRMAALSISPTVNRFIPSKSIGPYSISRYT